MPRSGSVRRTAARAATGSAVLLVAVTCAASCSAAPSPSTSLPEGITVGLEQNRSDIVDRRIGILVENRSGETLTLTGAILESTSFAGDAVWEKERTRITAGRTVQLPVQLGVTECDADETKNLVRLELRVGDQTPTDVTVEPEDEFDRLHELRTEDCFASEIAQIAELRISPAPTVQSVGATSVLRVDIGIEPTGRDDRFVIDEALGTTLLAPADPSTGAIFTRAPIDRPVAGTADPSILTLTFVPNRCDAHAVAEDKLGTVLPLAVTNSDGGSGVLMLEASPAAKTAMLDYLTGACAGR